MSSVYKTTKVSNLRDFSIRSPLLPFLAHLRISLFNASAILIILALLCCSALWKTFAGCCKVTVTAAWLGAMEAFAVGGGLLDSKLEPEFDSLAVEPVVAGRINLGGFNLKDLSVRD